ncbi:MAG: hypothetical protein GYB31_19720 [Bacteroidetes bacterium]|nr:hypothetical protein [Bacteroidota bacterium]
MGLHLWNGLRYGKPYAWSEGARPTGRSVPLWWMELIILSLEIGGLGEWYELGNRLIKWNTRKLTAGEEAMGKAVYGQSIPWKYIRVDGKARYGPRRLKIAYVSFFTINYWEKLRADVFIHELMHVWQYHHLGAIYIIRALHAQRTEAGYDYGGEKVLLNALKARKGLFHFNYEQQADIIADRWRLIHGMPAVWDSQAEAVSYHPFLKYLETPGIG